MFLLRVFGRLVGSSKRRVKRAQKIVLAPRSPRLPVQLFSCLWLASGSGPTRARYFFLVSAFEMETAALRRRATQSFASSRASLMVRSPPEMAWALGA